MLAHEDQRVQIPEQTLPPPHQMMMMGPGSPQFPSSGSVSPQFPSDSSEASSGIGEVSMETEQTTSEVKAQFAEDNDEQKRALVLTGSVEAALKASLEKKARCEICCEEASGNFFGAKVCMPCKTFFIRCSSDDVTNFQCRQGGQCDIRGSQRSRCKSCRYKRCIEAGMCRKERPEHVEAKHGQQLCVICGDLANGIHFGVTSCEGCKKFFRRGLLEWESYVCKYSRNCTINPRTRNDCRYCRYFRCIQMGMSRKAIKMGRPRKDSGRHESGDSHQGMPSLIRMEKDRTSGQPQGNTGGVVKPPCPLRNQLDNLNIIPPLSYKTLPVSSPELADRGLQYQNQYFQQQLHNQQLQQQHQLHQQQLQQQLQQQMIQSQQHAVAVTGASGSPAMASHYGTVIPSPAPASPDRSTASPVSDSGSRTVSVSEGEYSSNSSGYGSDNDMEPMDYSTRSPSRDISSDRSGTPSADSLCYDPASNVPSPLAPGPTDYPHSNNGNDIESQAFSQSSPHNLPSESEHSAQQPAPAPSDTKEKMVAFRFPAKFWLQLPAELQPVTVSKVDAEVLTTSLLSAYHRLVLGFIQPENDGPGETPEELLQKRLVGHTKLMIEFIKSIPGFQDVTQQDKYTIFRLAGVQLGIIVASLKLYDPQLGTFVRNFYEHELPPGNPLYHFRNSILDYAAQLASLRLTDSEAALLISLISVATDWPGLEDHLKLEKLFRVILGTLERHIAGDHGSDSKRLARILSYVPRLRQLGQWHYELTMKNVLAHY